LAATFNPRILALFTADQLPDVGNVKQTGTCLPSDSKMQTRAGFATALIIHQQEIFPIPLLGWAHEIQLFLRINAVEVKRQRSMGLSLHSFALALISGKQF